MANYVLPIVLALLALAFLAVFIGVTFRSLKALITTVWSGREGLNPQAAQGRFRLFGIVCLVVAVALLIMGTEQRLDVLGAPGLLVLIVAAGALFLSGVRLFQRAKRFDARSAIKVLSEDQRWPVLYLRSFDDDPKVSRRVGIAGFRVPPVGSGALRSKTPMLSSPKKLVEIEVVLLHIFAVVTLAIVKSE